MAHGGARKGAGRKPKQDEQALVEKLKPYEDVALKSLTDAVKAGESWAVKMFFEYLHGKPKETVYSQTEIIVPEIDWDGED
jgi:hypothetical protein